MSYLGRYMTMRNITVADYEKVLTKYIPINRQHLYNVCVRGLGHKYYAEDANIIAKRMACALQEITPNMEIDEDWHFDYRLILRPSKFQHWEFGIANPPGRRCTGLMKAVMMANMTKEDFMNLVDEQQRIYRRNMSAGLPVFEMNRTCARMSEHLSRLHRILGNDVVSALYGEKRWKNTLDLLLTKEGYCTAKLAFLFAECLEHFNVFVDYRMILEEVKRQDYLGMRGKMLLK